jgi:DNA-directed RNA polymerase specialized sigma24 family protein
MGTSSSVDESMAELRGVFREADDPVLTAVEVAERLGISQQAAHSRLSRSVREGGVERKKVGARAVVWWLPGYCDDSR